MSAAKWVPAASYCGSSRGLPDSPVIARIPSWRRNSVRALAALLGGIAMWGCGTSAQPPLRGVVVITLDTLRADHLGFAGYPRATSQFLDDLAGRSAVFTRAVASSSHTGPSHASLFTSLHPGQHGLLVNGMSLDEDVPTLAQAFRDAGYRTAAFVSAGFLRELDSGFRDFELSRHGEDLTRAVLDWLDALAPGEPFFLWLHYFDVHQYRYHADEKLAALAEGLHASDPPRKEWLRSLRELHGLAGSDEDLAKLLIEIDRYDASIAYVDRELGRLYRGFEERGRNSDSLWVVTSDHGEGLGSHDYAGHSDQLWNEQLRTPLLFAFGDGRYGGMRIDALVRHLDLAPTLAELVGLPGVENAEGRSLLPLMRGESEPERLAFSQRRPRRHVPGDPRLLQDKLVSIQSATHKLIRYSHGDDGFYDLRTDPGERRNLAGRDSPDEQSLRAALERAVERLDPEFSKEIPYVNPQYVRELRELGYLE